MNLYRMITAAAASAALATGALAGPALAVTAVPPNDSGNFTWTTLNDQADPTFNQLLGINDSGVISGYFGSGDPGHPNQGYVLAPPYAQANYTSENYPGLPQTQVTGLNNDGTTVGFSVRLNGANAGFYAINGQFHRVSYPATNPASPRFDQLLGVNDHNLAVGFYVDANNNSHGYSYNITTGAYKQIPVAGDTNVTASGINNLGDVAGFATNGSGTTEGFLKRSDGRVIHLTVPGSSSTQAFGVGNGDEVVGTYTVGTGSSQTTHGFVWAPGLGFGRVDDPNGVGATTLNGINDRGQLVGFYTDSAGNTDGLLATP